MSQHLRLPFPAILAIRPLRRRLAAALRACGLWFSRHRERQYLAEMDARMLRDIGADRFTAAQEARKWWWQA